MRADSKVLHWRPRARCDQPSHRRVPEPLVLGVSARVSSPRGGWKRPGGAPGGAAIWTTPGRSARIFSVGPCNFFIRVKSWKFLLSGKGTGVALGLLLWLAPGRAAVEPSCGV